jgi:cysteine dioxygenase
MTNTPLPPPVRLPRRDARHQPPAALNSLLAEFATAPGPMPLDRLERLLRELRVEAHDLGDAVSIDGGGYVRTLVFENAHFEVLVMAWLPGQRSPIHDHAGSACGVRVVSGRAREQLYRLRSDGYAEATVERFLGPGGTTAAFDRDIHDFGNATAAPASPRDILVTLHVYSPPLAPTQKYTAAPNP